MAKKKNENSKQRKIPSVVGKPWQGNPSVVMIGESTLFPTDDGQWKVSTLWPVFARDADGRILGAREENGRIVDTTRVLPDGSSVWASAAATVREPAVIVVDLKASTVTIHGRISIRVEPHHARIVDALVKQNGLYLTGPQMNKLPGCAGKKISREIATLKRKVPGLKSIIVSGRSKGYRVIR